MKEQIIAAKKLLESKGYIIKKESLKESYIDQFWDIYDRSQSDAEALENIARKLGIQTSEEPTEEEARMIVSSFKGKEVSSSSNDEIIQELMNAAYEIEGVSNVKSFEEDSLMTKNSGFTIYMKDGSKYQFSLLGSY